VRDGARDEAVFGRLGAHRLLLALDVRMLLRGVFLKVLVIKVDTTRGILNTISDVRLARRKKDLALEIPGEDESKKTTAAINQLNIWIATVDQKCNGT
jgi:hypothetical protein